VAPGNKRIIDADRLASTGTFVQRAKRAYKLRQREGITAGWDHVYSPITRERMTVCVKCKEWRPLKRASGHYSFCHPCANVKRRATRRHDGYENNRRRSERFGALGSYTEAEFEAVIKRQRGRCYDCGIKDDHLTRGHLVPLSRGGSNFIYNIVAQCGTCNRKQLAKIHPKAKPTLFDRIQP
jgi:5-methylcytosine-specific restriction endonuclease McrA